ncbi:MAG: HAD family hydrolase [Deltaproteobacteria bacterium]|nr:HAD family hydrolase [Deltaproteobacteria bacterium]
MKILALDFDGVISDSAPECFWVALRTLLRLRSSSQYREMLGRWDDLEGRQVRAAVSADPLYRGFLELMPLGNRAEDFGVALLALEAGVSLADQAAYDRYFAACDPAFAADFHDLFYRERDAFRAADPERWVQLMRPYGELIELLRRRSGQAEFVIATAKDGDSVAHLIDSYQIADLFGPERVFDKEAGRDKRTHLRAVREHFGAEFPEITFIDDKANHLITARELGVRCLLAAWGYNGPREHALARENGIEVCEIRWMESLVFD